MHDAESKGKVHDMTGAKRRVVKAETLKGYINDLLDWCASDEASNTDIAKVGGLSRQLVVRAQHENWDPPFSTIYALARARDKLLARVTAKARQPDA